MITQDVELTRVCRKCGKEKDIKCFPEQSRRNGRRRYQCFTCRSGHNTPKGRERHRAQWRRQNGVDITEEQYQELYRLQEGKCGICGQWFERLVPDHDHKTGQIRGLLCDLHNRALGLFGDSIEGLQLALNYLVGASTINIPPCPKGGELDSKSD